MKKALFLAAAALALSLGAYAQENGRRQRGERPDEATMIKMRTERMTQQLGLDETQSAKVLELNQKYPNVMSGGPGGPGRPGPGMGRPPRGERPRGERPQLTEDQKKAFEEARAAREAYEAELKEILTDDQFQTWKESQQRRPEGRGPGGPGGPGRRGFGGDDFGGEN
ncbi:MAG: DUF4890 domain-containing protein [Bacteroidales bacterium]|nr:DUF4890 domain-containing protein [Bacteroidales bacterium]